MLAGGEIKYFRTRSISYHESRKLEKLTSKRLKTRYYQRSKFLFIYFFLIL